MMNRMEVQFLWLAVFVLALPGLGGTAVRRPVCPAVPLSMKMEVPSDRKIPLGGGAYLAVSGRAAIAGLALDKAGV